MLLIILCLCLGADVSIDNAPIRSDLGMFVRSELGVRGGANLIVPSAWEEMADGLGEVFTIHSYDGTLYVGGSFAAPVFSSEEYFNVAKWSGTEWVEFGSGGLGESGLGAVSSVNDLRS